MPQKNSIKTFAPNQYYHIYNRGVAKQNIFGDDQDKNYLLSLFSRYLPNTLDIANPLYNHFEKNIEINAYCLMNNHFHFLFWLNEDPKAIPAFMKSVFTSYSMYFNRKYDRVGPLFQSRYKGSRISNNSYLVHISRYIHLNPMDKYREYKYSSYNSYIGENTYAWLKPERVKNLFNENLYEDFVSSYFAFEKDTFNPDIAPVDNFAKKERP